MTDDGRSHGSGDGQPAAADGKGRVAGAKADARHMPTVRRLVPPRPPTPEELAAWKAEAMGASAPSLPTAPPARPLLGIAIVGGMALGIVIVGLLAARSRSAPAAAPSASASAPAAVSASAKPAPTAK
jgi:hypothetical protein